MKRIEHERLKLEGQGKHAKHVRYRSPREVGVKDVEWPIDRMLEKAPDA